MENIKGISNVQGIDQGSGETITIDDFKEKYGLNALKQGMILLCPDCNEELYVHGLSSLIINAGFNHKPGTTCLLENGFGKGLAAPSDWDIENGKRIRELLHNKVFISKLYCFCHSICLKKNLSVDKFCELVREADKRNLWRAKDLEDWVIGFLLLLFGDFKGEPSRVNPNKEPEPYVFRFYLMKRDEIFRKFLSTIRNKRIDIKDVCLGKDYQLYKVFDNGNKMNFSTGNPYPVTMTTWERFGEDFEKTLKSDSEALLNQIKQLRERK